MSKLNGFDALVNRLNAASKEIQQEVKDITEYNLGEIELQAIRDAPGPGALISTQFGPENERDIVKDRGWKPISQAIGVQIDPSGYSGSVYVEASAGPVAAWIEFGTGQSAKSYLVTVPPAWRELARKYYLNGQGTIIAAPYLLPAFLKYQILYVKELKEALKNIKL